MKNFSRRRFIQTGLTGMAGLYALPLLKSCTSPASDTIRIGVIGLGRQSVFLTNGFNHIPGVKIVAGSDVYGIKRQRFELNVKKQQEELQQEFEVTTYENYEDLLSRSDIDAVIISTPDHWHAIQAIEACNTGKHVYLEKPVTFTIEEGKRVVEAVKRNGVVLAVGSQQRSDLSFQHARKMVQEGKLGQLKRVSAFVGPHPDPYNLPEEVIPADLNWEKWLGPLQYVHYNSRLNPPISLDPKEDETFWANWRYFKETGGGFHCDWGAHNFDIGQWTLDRDNSGPIEIIPAGYGDHKHVTFVYDDGILMVNEPFDEKNTFGVKFWSDDAWIEVTRGTYVASDDSLMPPATNTDSDVPYETGTPHLENFIESVRGNATPIAPINAGHRSGSCGILANIATELQRPLKWDPVAENFVDDSEAARHLHREYRAGYKLG